MLQSKHLPTNTPIKVLVYKWLLFVIISIQCVKYYANINISSLSWIFQTNDEKGEISRLNVAQQIETINIFIFTIHFT